MQKDNYKTVVIFRNFIDFGVTALFPYEIYRNGHHTITCYAHVGQHSEADYDNVVNNSTLATPEEYADLKAELESIGYDLDVKSKRHYNTFLHHYRQSKINLAV